jgi:hypothetical protein
MSYFDVYRGFGYLIAEAARKQRRRANNRRRVDTSTATLSTNPEHFGATIQGTPDSKKRVIGVRKLKGFEPSEKMERPESRNTVDALKKAIQSGAKLPRIVTHGNTVIDGHHRLKAHQELGTKNVKTVSPGRTGYKK